MKLADDLPWTPLPPAARVLYRLDHALRFGGLALALCLLPLLLARDRFGAVAVVSAVVLLPGLAATLGAWVGGLRHRRVRLRLDGDGLHVRQGVCWRSETLVPRTRVQHIDLERGPLLRRHGLATLVVHTAGTRLHAVRVIGLEAALARRLRDALVDREGGADDDAV